MKKTYIIPEAFIVELGAMQMMAESAPNVTIGDDTVDAEEVEVKENTTTLTNIWDVEW